MGKGKGLSDQLLGTGVAEEKREAEVGREKERRRERERERERKSECAQKMLYVAVAEDMSCQDAESRPIQMREY